MGPAMWSRGDICVEAEWTDASTISAATAALNFLTDFTNTEGVQGCPEQLGGLVRPEELGLDLGRQPQGDGPLVDSSALGHL